MKTTKTWRFAKICAKNMAALNIAKCSRDQFPGSGFPPGYHPELLEVKLSAPEEFGPRRPPRQGAAEQRHGQGGADCEGRVEQRSGTSQRSHLRQDGAKPR